MPATEAFYNRLAVVFDWDDTLAPDSFTDLLKKLDHEHDAFNEERIAPLEADGWDHVLARFYSIIDESRRRKERGDEPVTREMLETIGRETDLFDGVEDVFDRVRERADAACPGVEVEFYLLTGGAVEVAKATRVAGEFEAIWGCAFDYVGDDEEVNFLKRVVTHPEKVRYLLHLSKDGSPEPDVEPAAVYEDVDHGERHVPLDQIVFLGDGASDMPAFRLMNESNGIAIGIFHEDSPDTWRGQDDVNPKRRVQNLAPADYSEDSELMRSLLLSVESIGKRIALRKLGRGE